MAKNTTTAAANVSLDADVAALVKGYHDFVVANAHHDQKRATELLAQRDAILARDPDAFIPAMMQSADEDAAQSIN